MEIQIVTFVVKGSMKLTVPTDWQEQIQVGSRSVAFRRVFDLKLRGYIWPRYFSKSGLLMDKTSSMYLYVKLNWDANRFLPAESKDCMNSASYEYRNMSARRGAQFAPMGMPIICWKALTEKIMKMLSTRNSSILIMSSSVYLFFESECSFTKYGPSRTKTKYLYLRFPFLWRKEFRIKLLACF